MIVEDCKVARPRISCRHVLRWVFVFALSGKIEVEHVISKKLQLKRKAEVCESENDQPVRDLGRVITFIRIFLNFAEGDTHFHSQRHF